MTMRSNACWSFTNSGLWDFASGGTRSFYRVGSSAWKRDRIPFMIHLGLPTAKYTLCGWPRRALERTDIDVVPQTDTHFEIRLPTCAHCRSVADGTSELSGGQLADYHPHGAWQVTFAPDTGTPGPHAPSCRMATVLTWITDITGVLGQVRLRDLTRPFGPWLSLQRLRLLAQSVAADNWWCDLVWLVRLELIQRGG
jgi:hypothetical protein